MEGILAPRSPQRLSERRGKPELLLQPQSPALLHPVQSRHGTSTSSSVSSIASGLYCSSSDAYDTPAMSVPVTPTDAPPSTFKSVASPYGGSSVVGSIQEEEELGSCDCGQCEGHSAAGLPLNVKALDRQLEIKKASFEAPSVRSPYFDEPVYGTEHYFVDEKLAPVTSMPPTPPSQRGEHPYLSGSQVSPTTQTIDAEAFTSQPPPELLPPPHSPTSSTSSRAVTILNKVVPSKLRASLKRRLSSPNQPSGPPPPPPISTMPRHFHSFSAAEGSTAGGSMEFGGPLPPLPATTTIAESPVSLEAPEAVLPPITRTRPSFSKDDQESSPLSPRGLPYSDRADLANEHLAGAQLTVPSSPVEPPLRSPLVSPSVASGSRSSLPMSTPSVPVSPHRKVPSIDPATTTPRTKCPSIPLSQITVDTLADMIETMRSELAGYDAACRRMEESGWSSPAEIANVKIQRGKVEQEWTQKIEEYKKVLEGMKRIEMLSPTTKSSESSFSASASSAASSVSAPVGHVSEQMVSSAAASATNLPLPSF